MRVNVRTATGGQTFETATEALKDAVDEQTSGILATTHTEDGRELSRSDLLIQCAREAYAVRGEDE